MNQQLDGRGGDPPAGDSKESPLQEKRVVYTMPGTDTVRVQRDVDFPGGDGTPRTMDVYSPSRSTDQRCPVVVLVAGYPDPGVQRILGCKFKEMGSSVSWARLIAASGMVAVTYANQQPEADLGALVRHLTSMNDAYRIDASRLGVWASSGNAPLALSLLTTDHTIRPRCAALLYPLLMDLDGATAVADAAAQFHFVNPLSGRALTDLATDVPLFVARAGQDGMPRLNESLDRFAAAVLAANFPLTLVNHPTGPHAFDLFDDSAASQRVVRQTLWFLKAHLQ